MHHRLPDRRADPRVLRGRGLPAVLVRLGALSSTSPSAFVYVFNFLARLYWGFVGNKYANWSAFFPLKKSQRQEIVDVVKADVLEVKMHGPISTGHNALAGMIYFFTFLAFVFQTITGFALYSSMSNSWLPRMFTWIVPLMGGEFGGALLASSVPVVLCHLHHRSRVSCLLSRLHRGPRHGFLDHRRMEVRTGRRRKQSDRSSRANREQTLVLGLGNILMGDEGVGVHVVRALWSGTSLPARRGMPGRRHGRIYSA